MKKILLSVAILLLARISSNAQTYGIPCADLFFSEYIEPGPGFGGSKALEIYNPTPNPVNLSGYVLHMVSNGNCPGVSFALPPIAVAAGDVYVINNGNATGATDPFIQTQRDTVWTGLNFNGNDALYLINPIGDTLDIFGEICLNPGLYWPVNTTDSSQNITLIRNPNIHNGEKNWTTIGMYQWTGLPVNTFGNLGSHTMLPCGFPIPPVLLFDSTALTFNESAGTVIIPFRMANANAFPTSVTINLLGSGTATSGADFVYNSQTFTIPAYVNGLILQDTLHIIDDLIAEPTEDLHLQLTAASNALLTPQLLINTTIQINIADNDLSATNEYNFLQPTITSVNEASTTYSIPVVVNAASAGAYSVDVNLDAVNSTATAGVDFTYTNQTVNFASNVDTQYVSVTLLDDCACEFLENCLFKLANPTGGINIGLDSIYTLAINPNDSVPAITFGSSNYIFSEGQLNQTIALNLSAAYCDTIFVAVSVNSGSTYLPSPNAWNFTGQVMGTMVLIDTILPGQTTSSIGMDFFTNGMYNYGIAQNFNLDINYQDCFAIGGISTNSTTIDVLDIDPADEFSFGTITASQLENVSTVIVPVTFTNYYNSTSVVNINVVGGTATQGVDYLHSTSSLTFNPGDFILYDTITVINDLVYEGNETIQLQLSVSGPFAPSILNGNYTDTIIDDEIPLNNVSINFAQPTYNIYNEFGATYQIPVMTSGSGPGPFSVSFQYDPLNSTTVNGSDFVLLNPQIINFNSANDTQYIAFTIIDDCVTEFLETAVFTISNPVNAYLGPDTISTNDIIQSDQGPLVFFNLPTTQTVSESVGTDSVAIYLSNTFCAPITVYYSIAGTATNAVDYTGIGVFDSVVFNPGDSIKYIIFNVVDDALVESTENIVFSLINSTNSSLGGITTSVVNIIDNDALAPVVDYVTTNGSYIESAGTVTVPVQVTNMGTTAVSVTATLVGGTANLASDISGSTTQTVTFPAGSSSNQNITFTIIDDLLVEGNEQFTIVLSNPTGGAVIGANNIFTATINDNDNGGVNPTVQFQSSTVTINEGVAVVNIPVIVTNPNANSVAVNFTVTSGSCIAGSDFFTITNSPLTVAPFNTLNNIQVNIFDDLLMENTEQFTVTLGSATNANLGGLTTCVVNVTDNDFAIGIANPTFNAISVTPNPVANDGVITIKGLNGASAASFTLYTVLGTEVLSTPINLTNTVNLSHWPLNAGIYLYTIKDGNGRSKEGKIIIE